MLRYIRGTLHLPLILRVDSLNVIKWWFDASFADNPDCKGRTGAMIPMGSGSMMEISWKQKINRGSSTKSKIVGAENALPQCLWSRYLVERQGYSVEDIEFHQDNMSFMLMEKIAKESSMK